MLFHVTNPPPQGFNPGADARKDVQAYHLSPSRVFLGFGFFILLLAISFAAKALKWEEGATGGMHMAEVVFGGITGLIFGERLALNDGK